MISAAFFWPMPWMYWSSIKPRLLVGIFTPAIRATDFSPVADPLRTAVLSLSRASVRKREHDALPLGLLGARHRLELSDLDTGLLKDSTWFRQPSLCFSSLFRDLFGGFSTPPDRSDRGTLRRGLGGGFCPPGGSLGGPRSGFGGLFRSLDGFPGRLAGSPRGLAGSRLFGRLGLDRPDRGQDAVDLAGDVLDRHHAVDREQLAALGIVVNQGLGQRAVARQPLRQHFRSVVDPDFLAARPHLGNAGLDPVEQRAFVDAKLDHRVEPHVLLPQQVVERLGLRHRARKAVEDKTVLHVRLVEAVGN